MLPLVPRIPMLGGKLAAKKKEEFGSAANNHHHTGKRHDFRSWQLMHGGPVQRAISADLLSLRQEFRNDLEKVVSSMSRINHKVPKPAPGKAFQVFKETFRRTKFGIIHTRCCPPRCDKEAYIQMIFSATLELLSRELKENLCNRSMENETIQTSFVDAIFAVFALYVLYETNPLPHFPLNVGVLQKRSCDDLSASELKEIMSMMPMGASSDQGGRRAFRRYFRAPIRISLYHYFSLIQLRDVSMAVMDSLSYSSQQPSFIRDMAVDGVCIIDRLKPLLLLCEYSGPGSMESLVGSEEYYHSVVLNEKDKYAAKATDITSILSNIFHNKQGEDVSISSLEESMTARQQQYDKLLGCISLDINRYKSNARPSVKLKAIENILQDIIQGRMRQKRSDCSTLSQKIKNAKSSRHSVDMSGKIVYDNDVGEESALANPLVINNYRNNIGDEQNCEFHFPSSLSIGVKAGILKAFSNRQMVTDSSQHQPILKSQTPTCVFHNNKNVSAHHNDWLFDDYLYTELDKEHRDEESEPTAIEMEDLHGVSALENLLSLVENSRQKRSYLRTDSDDDNSSMNSEASLDSFGTGPGNKALEVLLALPKVSASMKGTNRGRTKDRVRSTRPNSGKRNRKQANSKQVSSQSMKMEGSIDKEYEQRKKQKQHDDKSVLSSGSLSTKGVLNTSEPGQNALQSLLLQAGNSSNTNEHSSSSVSSDASSNSLEEEETSSEHGKNALNNLLSKIV